MASSCAPLDPAAVGSLSRAFPARKHKGAVDYVAFSSWLNPCRVDKAAKKARRALAKSLRLPKGGGGEAEAHATLAGPGQDLSRADLEAACADAGAPLEPAEARALMVRFAEHRGVDDAMGVDGFAALLAAGDATAASPTKGGGRSSSSNRPGEAPTDKPASSKARGGKPRKGKSSKGREPPPSAEPLAEVATNPRLAARQKRLG